MNVSYFKKNKISLLITHMGFSAIQKVFIY
nr:MAG TPA: hypothetical protein [Bacteriophage sp.]